MIELLACTCSVAVGGKFVVLAVLFAIWMISLILSRPRGPQGDQLDGLHGNDELRRSPRGPAGDDMTQDIAFRPASTRPAREIVTRPDLMDIKARPGGWQFVRILIVVAVISGLVTAGILFAWFKMKDRLGESDDIREGGAETTQPAESEDIAAPLQQQRDDDEAH